MPIQTQVPISVFDQPAFHAIDELVTGKAFEVHNEFGRFLNEQLVQAELLRRLIDSSLDAIREMKISLTLDGFVNDYFVDFLINGGVIVETKVVDVLTPQHRAQVLGYLFLCDLNHATLLNFRGERVQREFVSTQLTSVMRRQVTYNEVGWIFLTDRCSMMIECLKRALADWGSGLDPALYRDAITWFLGGEAQVVRDVPVFSAGVLIGTQPMHVLTEDIAFSITASVHSPNLVLEHQKRFLQHTNLKAIQWVNLNRQSVSLTTIAR